MRSLGKVRFCFEEQELDQDDKESNEWRVECSERAVTKQN